MFVTIAFDVLVLAYILSRQLRIRAVPRLPRLQVPLILGIIGLIQFVDYTGSHHVTQNEYDWVLGTLIVGAGLLGAIRALTVKIWIMNNWVVRQGTWVTMTLWVVSLAAHFLAQVGANHTGAGNFEASSLLLYIGVTFGLQNYVVHRRAMPLWDSLGPQAGRPIQINFGQGPGGGGAFFTNFRNFGSDGPPPTYNDPNIIDVDVVDDDDDGPAQLR
jgi:hypothetical protein